jgi:uncharacterized protein (TIGR02246 family)
LKKRFLAFCVGCAFVSAQAPQQKRETRQSSKASIAQEPAMEGIAEKWRNAYNAGDASKVASLYTEDAYYLSAHIVAHGRQAIKAYWQRGIAAGGYIDFIRPLTTFSSGELGYTAGTYQATNAGRTVDGRILLVLRKINCKWLIAAHDTVVRDQP